MTFQIALSPDELGPFHYVAEWTRPPQVTPLVNLPTNVDRGLMRWLYDEGQIEIDIDGPPLSISRCSRLLYNYNFGANDCVLMGDNLAARMPVHLRFPTPMRAIGAHVSALGLLGSSYLAQGWIRLDGQQWQAVPPRLGSLTRARGSAPFMGAVADPGHTIDEAWFDVIDPGNVADFARVAINGLRFVPDGAT